VECNISTLNTRQIETLVPAQPDVVIGGPPCQGFSICGPKDKDPRDPRNSLFVDFARFVEVLQPRLFVMENVKGILRAKTAEGRSVTEIIIRHMERLGYNVIDKTLFAADYGVPQMRERVFFFGALDDPLQLLPIPTHALEVVSGNGSRLALPFDDISLKPYVTLWEALSDLPDVDVGDNREFIPYNKPPTNEYQSLIRRGADGVYNHVPMQHSRRLIERFQRISYGESGADAPPELGTRRRGAPDEFSNSRYDQNNRRMHPDRICHTIAASFYANFIHPFKHRNFTAREGARIQSFPDAYVFCGKRTTPSHRLLAREGRHDERYLCQYNQIGNAVPPLLAQSIARACIRALDSATIRAEVGHAGSRTEH
jgi:DNA (cytosine-5)-methyltransferase 1